MSSAEKLEVLAVSFGQLLGVETSELFLDFEKCARVARSGFDSPLAQGRALERSVTH